ncbi:MAG: T9SS type A sorting domain-containing protein [Chitinophagaceae bacterium]|nr:T9SS type A sorting domain-containing protein [Chitinophagaceae bacterium]
MKILFTLFGLISGLASFSQFNISGSGTSASVANNAPAITVDDGIVVTGIGNIDGIKVSVSTSFSSGDILTYTGSLPSGVSANYNSSTGILTFSGNASPLDYQALLRTVTFRTTSSSTSQRTITYNLGNALEFSGTGHFYEYISGSYNWTNAKTEAALRTLYGLKGYLATITSQAENDFIQQKLGADAWIGASDDYSQINAATGTSTYVNQAASEGHWYWVTGPVGEIGTNFSNGNNSPIVVSGKYMNWNGGEPNNSGSIEHYGEIYSSGASGKWNDLSNTALLGYVVEYGGMSGDPAVNLSYSRNVVMIATSLQTTASSIVYLLHSPAFTVDNGLLVYSAGAITDTRVTISSNFQSGDALSYTGALPSGVTSSYNATNGVLSFTGTTSASNWQNLLRTVQFTSSSNVIGNRVITFSAGNLVASNNGHFYEYVSTAATWTTAKTNAAAKTYLGLYGYLATITSQAENDFIRQKLGADAWIGASDNYLQINAATGTTTYPNQAAAEGHWYWVTGPVGEIGTNFSNGNNSPAAVSGKFMNWNAGEPNNSGGSEDYAEIFSSGGSPGKWNDLPNNSLGYVVEYGGLASDPLVYLSANRTISISSILPVTGLKFSAAKNTGGILLQWSTNTEVNTDHFVIEYSPDGIQFNMLAQMAAAGNSDIPKNYQWLHTNPSNQNNFYRIREVDMDNRFTLSEVRQVYNGWIKAEVTPDPVVSELNVFYPYSGKPVSLSIVNSVGSVVYKATISQNKTSISANRLSPGIYFILIDEKSVLTRLRFIKQ